MKNQKPLPSITPGKVIPNNTNIKNDTNNIPAIIEQSNIQINII